MSVEQFPQPQLPRMAEATIAASPEELMAMKEQGKDPIIGRANEHEVYIYTKDQRVIDAIVSGNNWSGGDLTPDAQGYVHYVYTRLNEGELAEHIKNPEASRGED